MSRIACGYGAGLSATLKSIQCISQARRALEKAKHDASVQRIQESVRREDRSSHPPTPTSRANPALDNRITK